MGKDSEVVEDCFEMVYTQWKHFLARNDIWRDETSKKVDFCKQPKDGEVWDALDGPTGLYDKPTGKSVLEKEQKHHEDLMRKGKGPI